MKPMAPPRPWEDLPGISHDMIQAIPVAVIALDVEGRVRLWNAAAESMFGWSQEEVLGKLRPTIPQAAEKECQEELAAVIAGGNFQGKLCRRQAKDGKLLSVALSTAPLRNPEGKVYGVIGFLVDVTEEKKKEKEIQDTNDLLKATFAGIADGVLVIDPHDRSIISANPTVAAIFGYDVKEMIGRNTAFLHKDMEAFREWNRRSMPELDRHGIFRSEWPMRRKSGEVFWAEIAVRGISEDRGWREGVVSVIRDITERKRMEQDLLSAKKSAEAANEAKSQFLANISHELRTPLTVVMGSLEFLTGSWAAPERNQFLEMANTSAHKLLGIIDDLLDISKIEARQLKVKEQPFDLRDCIFQAVKIFASTAREKGIHLHWTVDQQVPEQVIGDSLRLGQVLINLLGNAVKFTQCGEVKVKCEEQQGELVFRISDTGIGIPADKIKHLFQPFSQVDSSMTRPFGGTGLGLAISKELVEMMGGAIKVESSTGNGSTFTFTIPSRPTDYHEEQFACATHEKSVRPLKVLLAEDDPMVRDLMTMILQQRVLSVAVAKNGREAVARWQEGGIDLVFMDLQMPEMDGLEATRKIRELERGGDQKVCIFALTAHAQPEDRQACEAAGMDGFLSKPLDIEELNQLLKTYPCGAQAKTSPNL